MEPQGFNKIVEIEPYFPTGEMSIQPVVLWANGKPHYEQLTKHASVGSDYFKSIQPVPGHSIVYVLALGAWETYGENRNGDGFPEFAYMDPAITEKDSLVQHYKTFEQGHNFRHHQNKDPKKAVGKVLKAFWNPSMHRVELLVDLEDAKAPDLAERIASGEFPPVSMGTRVKYDVCSLCLNKAPTRAQYCDHLKFQMRDVIDGKKVAALNPSPRFFDISWVFRPADATAFMMKKVAENTPYEVLSGARAGEYLDRVEHQKAAAHKLAVINKVVQGVPVDAKSCKVDSNELNALHQMRPLALEAGKNTPDFPDDLLKDLAKHPFPSITSSLEAAGLMRLSTPEVTKVIIYKSYPNSEVPDSILHKTVGAQQGILDLFEELPQLLDKLKATGILSLSENNVKDDIVKKVTPFLEKRSGIGQYLKRRIVPEAYRDETPYSTPLSLTDPASGHQYRTTRGAAIRAHDEVAKRNLYKVVGGAGLLAGAYKLIGSGLNKFQGGRYKALKPIVGIGLAGLGLSQYPSMGKHYMTDQGIPIPINTELAKSAGAEQLALPAVGTLALMAGLAHDYQSRLKSGIPLGYSELPLSRRVLDNVESFADEHPILTAAGGTLGLYGTSRIPLVRDVGRVAKNVFKPVAEVGVDTARGARETLRGLGAGIKQSSVIEEVTSMPDSAVTLPDVNLDKLAEWLGWTILEG